MWAQNILAITAVQTHRAVTHQVRFLITSKTWINTEFYQMQNECTLITECFSHMASFIPENSKTLGSVSHHT